MVPPVYVLVFFFLCSDHKLSLSSASGECPSSFDCGNLGKLGFPITTPERKDCGMLAIQGCQDSNPNATKTVQLSEGGKKLEVTGIDSILTDVYVRDADLQKRLVNGSCEAFCCSSITIPPSSAFGDIQIFYNTLYKCNSTLKVSLPNGFLSYDGCAETIIYFGTPSQADEHPPSLAGCPRVQLPVSSTDFSRDPFTFIHSEFSLQLILSIDCNDCIAYGGLCRLNGTGKFYCFKFQGVFPPIASPNPPPENSRPQYQEKENSRHRKIKFIIGLTSGVVGSLLISICIIRSLRQKIGILKTSRVDQNIEAFIKSHGPLALTRYKFADLKKMTKSFKVKLGQGGYGAVYKGELLNGCPIAVKLLKPSKGNGEEFVNEVVSISKTSHVNVVNLLGFCLEGRKKALIYEFMFNGSLDRFIHNKADNTSPSLTWENLYQIAIGTAQGLEYLYKGCNTRILHFDIKPHNILLDENLCPKISDFGLAKLCSRKESIISISKARGTVGYLAPEVWNRNVGGVSHKSDVYSYGMMLLDMVGESKKMNSEANCRTENYFPDWIYDKLEQGSDLGHDGVNTKEEKDIAKKMTIVGLWCIQTFPTQRPTISRVIEMLEGSLDSLETPPKPVMSSPPRLEVESSTTTNATT